MFLSHVGSLQNGSVTICASAILIIITRTFFVHTLQQFDLLLASIIQ